MNVIPFRPRPKPAADSVAPSTPGVKAPAAVAALTAPTAAPAELAPKPAPKRRKLRATLVLTRTKDCGKVNKATTGIGQGHFVGKLTVAGKTIEAKDGHPLGLAAWSMNVGSVEVSMPTYPERTLKVLASRTEAPFETNSLMSSTDRKQQEEALFVRKFQSALHFASTVSRRNLSLTDTWDSKLVPEALALVPDELIVHKALERAPAYADDGEPMTAKALAVKIKRDADYAMLKKILKGEISVEPEHARMDMTGVLRMLEDGATTHGKNDPVVWSGKSEFQMRQALARFGFERLPFTYAELQGLLDYFDELDTGKGTRFPADERHLWQQGTGAVWARHRPLMLPALTLYCAGDIAGLRALHKAEDTLTRLGMDYKEPVPEDERFSEDADD